MNDTPETDGEWNRIACYEHPQFEQAIADFARKMERERNEWKEVAEGSLLGTIHERDDAEKRASESVDQVDKMLLQIEEMKCKHENECRKLKAGLGNIICDLQDAVANLRRELNTTKHSSDSWRDGYRAVSDERDKYYNELLTKRGLCKVQEQVINDWKAEAEKWRKISK